MRDYAAALEREQRYAEAVWWKREAAAREKPRLAGVRAPVWPPSYVHGIPGTWTSYNGLAIYAVVFGLVGLITFGLTSIPAIVLGHVAWVRVRRSGQPGRWQALAGIVLGWLMVGVWVWVVFTVVWVA